MLRKVISVETEYNTYDVNMETIEKITYHTPNNQDRTHYADVHYKDKTVHRIFSIKAVDFMEVLP